MKDKEIPTEYDKQLELSRNFFKSLKSLNKDRLKEERIIFLDYEYINKYSKELTSAILVSPEETIQLMETALDELVGSSSSRVRLTNVPITTFVRLDDIRAKHLNKLITLEGYLVQASDVRPQVVNAKFECPSCGTIISVLQIEKKFREPSRCSCGRKGQFRLLDREMVDVQRIVISDTRDMQKFDDGIAIPRAGHISVFIQEDLVDPNKEIFDRLGQKIKVIGTLKDVPVEREMGGISTRFDLAVEANNLFFEKESKEIKINEEDEKKILKMSKDPKILEKFAMSVSPSVWGYQEIKESLVLQLFGGATGNINTLIVGDPGVGKLATLESISDIALNGLYLDGIIMSEEEISEKLASKNLLSIYPGKKFIVFSNLTNLSFYDGEAIKSIKKQIAEGNSILASGIPKLGRFEPYQTITQQFDIPPTITNKFDLIFIIRDIPDKFRDESVAETILRHHNHGSNPPISRDLFRKYLAYAKSKTNPKLTEEAIREIKNFYVKMRNLRSNLKDNEIVCVPISSRQVETMAKIAEAHARIRLSDKATKEDAKKAIDILTYFLMQVGYDYDIKTFDIDRIAGVSSAQRRNLALIMKKIEGLEDRLGKFIPLEELQLELKKKITEDELDDYLQKLIASGDIFIPRKGFVQKI